MGEAEAVAGRCDVSSTWILVVIIPLALTEFGSWATWLATKVVRCAARCLGEPDAVARYTEEFTATITAVPGQLTRLAVAVGILAAIPVLRHVLRATPAESAPEPGNPLAETAEEQTAESASRQLSVGARRRTSWTPGATDDRRHS